MNEVPLYQTPALSPRNPSHPTTLLSTFFFFFFFTLVTGPRRSLSLKLSDVRVYEPQMRARLGITTHVSPSCVALRGVVQEYLAHKKQPPPLGPP